MTRCADVVSTAVPIAACQQRQQIGPLETVSSGVNGYSPRLVDMGRAGGGGVGATGYHCRNGWGHLKWTDQSHPGLWIEKEVQRVQSDNVLVPIIQKEC